MVLTLAMLSDVTRRPVCEAIIPDVAVLMIAFSDMDQASFGSANRATHDAPLPGETCRVAVEHDPR